MRVSGKAEFPQSRKEEVPKVMAAPTATHAGVEDLGQVIPVWAVRMGHHRHGRRSCESGLCPSLAL